jgi:hypothetical protein
MTTATVDSPTGADAAAIQAALDAVEGGGIVLLDPGKVYTIDATLTVKRDPPQAQVILDGQGATIRWDAATAGATMMQFDGGGSHGTHAGVVVRDLHLDGAGVATTGFRWTDCGRAKFRDVWVSGVAGVGINLRNFEAFSENVSATGMYIAECTTGVHYQGVTQTGGPGTESFARSYWSDVQFAGCATGFLIQGAVYAAHFEHIKGNGVGTVFKFSAGCSGTVISHVDFEQGTGDRYIVDAVEPNTNLKVVLLPTCVLRNGYQLLGPNVAGIAGVRIANPEDVTLDQLTDADHPATAGQEQSPRSQPGRPARGQRPVAPEGKRRRRLLGGLPTTRRRPTR